MKTFEIIPNSFGKYNSSNPNSKSYGFFIDLNITDTVNKAIQFKDEDSFNSITNEVKAKFNPKYDVGIGEKDGSITTESFAEFKKRFNFN